MVNVVGVQILQLPEGDVPVSPDSVVAIETADGQTVQVPLSALVGGAVFGAQSAHRVFAGPVSGSPDSPAFRQLSAADISNGTTGTGALALANSPTLVTPTLGAATATSINTLAITGAAGSLVYDGAFTLHVTANASVGGTNTGDVTLAGENYLTRAGQVITAHPVDLSGSNVTGVLPLANLPALVDSAIAGTGISVSAATGNVTFTNIGVTSIIAGSNVTIDHATGAVTISSSGGGGGAPPAPILTAVGTRRFGEIPLYVVSPIGQTVGEEYVSSGNGPTLDFFKPFQVQTGMTSLELTNITGCYKEFGGWTAGFFNDLVSFSAPALVVCCDIFDPSDLPVCTTFNFPVLASVGGFFNPKNLASLVILSFPLLAAIGDEFRPENMASCTTLDFPELAYVYGDFRPGNLDAVTTVNVPNLVHIMGSIDIGPGAIGSMASLANISFPALTYVGVNISVRNTTPLVSLSLPVIETIGVNINIQNSATFTTFSLPASLKSVGGDVLLMTNALTQASVDSVLVRLAALDGTGGTTTYSGHTVDLSLGANATPSAAGLAAKATLVGRGCTVNNN